MDFNQLYEQYNEVIYRLCLGYTNDPHKAKDIVQDTFVAVWKSLDQFRGEAQISTWIYRIAVNNCIRQLSKDKKKKEKEMPIEIGNAVKEEPPKIILLRKLIKALPEVDRLIISMELEEIPQVEIADILGMTHANVRVRVHRIKDALSKQFKSHGYV